MYFIGDDVVYHVDFDRGIFTEIGTLARKLGLRRSVLLIARLGDGEPQLMDTAHRIYTCTSHSNTTKCTDKIIRNLRAALSTNLGVMAISTEWVGAEIPVTGIWLGDKLFHTSMRYDKLFGGEQCYTADWYTSELTYINANFNICRCTDGRILPIASAKFTKSVTIASIGNDIYTFDGRDVYATDVRSGDHTLMATKMSKHLGNGRHRTTRSDLLLRAKPLSDYAVAVGRHVKYEDTGQPLGYMQKCVYDMRSPSVPYVYPYEAYIPTECDFHSMIL